MTPQGAVAAAQLRVAESWIAEFGRLAQKGNSLIIPTNLADAAGIVAAVTKIIKPQEGLAALAAKGATGQAAGAEEAAAQAANGADSGNGARA